MAFLVEGPLFSGGVLKSNITETENEQKQYFWLEAIASRLEAIAIRFLKCLRPIRVCYICLYTCSFWYTSSMDLETLRAISDSSRPINECMCTCWIESLCARCLQGVLPNGKHCNASEHDDIDVA